ncbi:hypothetical protein A1O3_02948 [Capronia epimyces CBS 606.96]|uniref:Cyclohexanone monooxygenase n=1 Tax=Capronia epimyces CBS 606.96 TaxID=1182542 RepID=W9YKY8_9EURO|nr:uncharacterized protein A1O3_02948 [Capronia epimyces CBS 606.96]EXJ89881.1 hypothetical protein A1O3_02948 [Capronia epimyces CBS 606.96]
MISQMEPVDPRVDSAAYAEELGWTRVNERGYEILERPYGTHAPKKVISIGAGATGICLAHFSKELPELEVQIYEKNDGAAGTWWENKYPGCACDIPAHIYQFTWSLNPNWSKYYVTAEEILAYFQSLIEKHDLEKFIKLQHAVVGANWNSETSKWHVQIQRGDGTQFEDTCDFLVNGSGLLNNWKWPDIKGLKSYKGVLTHSASYDPTIQLEGKKVAVIGAGSSGVQIVAAIQSKVEHLYTWVRSPLWISAGFASKYAGPDGANFEYSDELKKKWAADPVAHLRYVKMLDDELGKRFNFNLTNSPEAKTAVQFSRESMAEKLKTRPDLIKKLIPTNFGIGCRRPTPGTGYLDALVADNVTTFTEEVREITPTGFIDSNGEKHDVDVIICATGFDTSFVPRFPVTANGKDLRKVWENDPVAYFSVMVPGFPNYFTSLGPYSASNGSLLPPIEHGCRYILKLVEKSQIERIKSLAPKEDVTNQFREHSDLLLKRTVWNQPCRSWFKNGTIDGLPRCYPGSRTHFVETMQPRYEDFEIEYERDNRFYYLGNGFATRELDGRDATLYLGELDGQDKEPDYTPVEEEVFALSGVNK